MWWEIKNSPRAEHKELKNGVAMLDFEECGHGRKKKGQWRGKSSKRYTDLYPTYNL